ncbi:ABC transporter ATP-binding protein [Oceanobacillus sp. J11TS1]|uniref:ABC transporter ATP-binding protein n=1 Tax=Oceanobacillus sp. J11TS1 TaxID=2807191 RepID=UPI001BB3BDAF|nr:ABC transporter ATP-binding protein [Oceanobacillus sp. J11TS1]
MKGEKYVLKLSNVTKRFGTHTAVNDLSLEIPESEMFGFLGGNGAGKTTTFRMILGLLDKTEGEITWQGNPISYQQSHLIGYLPEERGLYPKLTVKEQIIYLGRLRGMKKHDILQKLDEWLNRFKVPEYLDKKVQELSKGNQQKIQFISAVIHEPKLLILDEPFSGLDPVNVEMLKQAVVDLKNAGTSIVFSSHQMGHVEEMCQHVCILQKGTPVVHGSLRDIKKEFGKKNLSIRGEFSMEFLKDYPGVTSYKALPEGCTLHVDNEQVAQDIFASLQGKGFVSKFEIEEPSLNDIFIAKVGASYE